MRSNLEIVVGKYSTSDVDVSRKPTPSRSQPGRPAMWFDLIIILPNREIETYARVASAALIDQWVRAMFPTAVDWRVV
jgi:hypothetical protein